MAAQPLRGPADRSPAGRPGPHVARPTARGDHARLLAAWGSLPSAGHYLDRRLTGPARPQERAKALPTRSTARIRAPQTRKRPERGAIRGFGSDLRTDRPAWG